MCVLALMPQRYHGGGGIAQYCRDFLSALSASEDVDRIDIVARDSSLGRRFRDGCIRELCVSRTIMGFATAALSAALFVRPRLVVCAHIHHLPVAYLAAKLGRSKIVLLVYGVEAWSPPGGPWYRWAIERVDCIIPISRYTRQRILDWADIEWFRLKIAPNAVPREFSASPYRSAHVVNKAEIQRKTKRKILTIGRILKSERYKGHDRVILVLSRLLRHWPGLKYVIAGSGDGVDELRQLAETCGVSENVEFVGHVDEAEKWRLYREADVFVMPSTGEGFGFVFLEAAAQGLPVIGASVAGSLDALREGRLGRCVDPENLDALEEALEQCLQGGGFPDAEELRKYCFSNYCRHILDCVLATGCDDNPGVHYQ